MSRESGCWWTEGVYLGWARGGPHGSLCRLGWLQCLMFCALGSELFGFLLRMDCRGVRVAQGTSPEVPAHIHVPAS